MTLAVAVFIAGGLGALTRFAVDRAVTRRWQGTLLLGTFAVNVSGSLLLGIITGYTAAKVNIAEENLLTIIGTGFLGSYTTFSTEEWETLVLARAGAGIATLNLAAALAASLAAGALVRGWEVASSRAKRRVRAQALPYGRAADLSPPALRAARRVPRCSRFRA